MDEDDESINQEINQLKSEIVKFLKMSNVCCLLFGEQIKSKQTSIEPRKEHVGRKDSRKTNGLQVPNNTRSDRRNSTLARAWSVGLCTRENE